MKSSLQKDFTRAIFAEVQKISSDVDNVHLRYEFDQRIPEKISIDIKRRPKWIEVSDELKRKLSEFFAYQDQERDTEDGLLGILVSISPNGSGTRYLRSRLDIWSLNEEDFGSEKSFFSAPSYIQTRAARDKSRASVMSSAPVATRWQSIAYAHFEQKEQKPLTTFLCAPTVSDFDNVDFMAVTSLFLSIFDNGRFFDYSEDPDVKISVINSDGELNNYHSDREGVYWTDNKGNLVFHALSNPSFDKYDTDKYVAYDDSDTYFSEVCHVDGDRLYRVVSVMTDDQYAERYVYLYKKI